MYSLWNIISNHVEVYHNILFVRVAFSYGIQKFRVTQYIYHSFKKTTAINGDYQKGSMMSGNMISFTDIDETKIDNN